MSQTPFRRAAGLLVAVIAVTALPATASAKKQDLKVMTRNVYLGADLIPLASAPSRDAFEHAAAERFQTVARNDFPTRAKALAREIAKVKPDIVGVQEATTWRRGSAGVKDGSATPAQQIIYDSTEELLKALRAAGAQYHEAVGRDWFDFEAPTSLGYDIRITQRDVVLVRNKSKVKVRKTFRGGFKTFLTVPTQAGNAEERRGWVGLDGTLAKRKFRFVSTHLEAYSADIAEKQMKELVKSSGPVGSRKKQTILVGDFNSQPAYKQAIKAGFSNRLPKRWTCCFSEDLHNRARSNSTWIDHVVVRPRIKLVKSGIVGLKQVGGLYPSDHAGIFATLRLK
jgi:endonuclease/exonuclease/phosphatase family metal-dependent hydrolase